MVDIDVQSSGLTIPKEEGTMTPVTSTPLVSIIIPVYNGIPYLREAIESALAQTYSPIEILVINDGSTDNGATDALARTYGEKIRYLSKPNGGVASALNLGIKEMKGEYFSWLSHDDVYYPEKIEKQIHYLNTLPSSVRPYTILYSDFEFIDKDSHYLSTVTMPNVTPQKFRSSILFESFLHGCSTLIPRSCFVICGLFNEQLRTTQDYDYWFRIAARYHFTYQPEVLIKSRTHAEQGTQTMSAIHYRECTEFFIRAVNELTSADISTYSNMPSFLFYFKLARNLRSRHFVHASFTPLKKGIRTLLMGPAAVTRHILSMIDTNRSAHARTQKDFSTVYKNNLFFGKESHSGEGSGLDQTAEIRKVLPQLLQELRIKTMLDAPCGDWFWMSKVDLGKVKYTGGDIVPELITRNTEQHGTTDRTFTVLNIATSELPTVDLVFCRDCLVHLSFKQAKQALRNFKKSGSTYLLTTTFPGRTVNKDPGGAFWEPLNLQIAPFDLPEPLRIINEHCSEANNSCTDKSLALYRLADLPEDL